MSRTVNKISVSGNNKAAWMHMLPLDMDELAALKQLGVFTAGTASIKPFVRQVPIFPEQRYTILWFPLAGSVTVKDDTQSLIVKPGEVVFRPCNIPHTVTYHKPGFKHAFFLANSLWTDEIYKRPFADHATIGAFVELVYRENFEQRRGYKETIFNASSILSIFLKRIFQKTPESSDRIENIFRLVKDDPKAKWTTSILAKHLNMSDSLLYKLCVKYYGKKPSEIISDIKLGYARELLEYGQKSLDEIAGDTGYSTSYAFSKAFTRKFGIRPGTLRKKSLLNRNHLPIYG